MIEILPRDESEHALWAATLDLADLLAGPPWTLVGAQMVMLHAFEAGEIPGRTTGDLDVLFDVRAHVGATAKATKRLLSTGFVEAGLGPDGIAHRFASGHVVVDILAPDGLGERTSKAPIAGGRTVQVPGGSQALDRTQIVDVRMDDRAAKLPRPSLLRRSSSRRGRSVRHRMRPPSIWVTSRSCWGWSGIRDRLQARSGRQSVGGCARAANLPIAVTRPGARRGDPTMRFSPSRSSVAPTTRHMREVVFRAASRPGKRIRLQKSTPGVGF